MWNDGLRFRMGIPLNKRNAKAYILYFAKRFSHLPPSGFPQLCWTRAVIRLESALQGTSVSHPSVPEGACQRPASGAKRMRVFGIFLRLRGRPDTTKPNAQRKQPSQSRLMPLRSPSGRATRRRLFPPFYSFCSIDVPARIYYNIRRATTLSKCFLLFCFFPIPCAFRA